MAATARIPIVDIGGLYSDDPAAKARVAAEIGAACDEIGFFYAVGHPVPAARIDDAFRLADEFFALPMERKLLVKADKNNRGYREAMDGIHRNGIANSKDSFDLGYPVAADDPEVVAGTPLYAPNNWPALPGFEAAVEGYYRDALAVGMKVLEGFAIYLGQEPDFFARHFSRPIADMVINHYFGVGDAMRASDQASGAHTDHGIVTVLCQDSSGGLQVMGRDGAWIDAAPVPGAFVINVGELMKRWTNGRFVATVHQVVHFQSKPRYSLALFCNPDYRTVVDPRALGVAAAEAKYPPVLSGDFLVSRFKATRKLWGAEAGAAGGDVAVEMAAD